MPRRPAILILPAALVSCLALGGCAKSGPFAQQAAWGQPGTICAADNCGAADVCATADPCVSQECVAQPVMQQPVMQQPVMQQQMPCAPEGCLTEGCAPEGCVAECGPDGCTTGCGPEGFGDCRYRSDDWWAMRAMDPPGQRQKCKYGKKWPVYPRPTGKRQTFIHRYHTAHAWPHPYVCDDRTAVNVTAEMTARSGWNDINTLHGWHFNPATGELNDVGAAHLHYLITHSPSGLNKVFVARDVDSDIAGRLAVVEQSIIAVTGRSDRFAVLPRDAYSTTRPATETEAIYRQMLNTIPAPVLSTASQAASAPAAPQL